MQREIKFRAWDKTRKEFLSGGEVLIAITKGSKPKSNPIYLDIIKDPDFYKERFVLQQFTGLKDKNSKEIYEGDVCLVSLKYFDIKNEKALVIYKDGCFCFQYGYCSIYVKTYRAWDTDSIELIGNIYDNPELLQEVD